MDARGEEVLADAYARLWALQSATRLLSSRPLNLDALRSATRRFVFAAVDICGQDDTAELFQARLAQIYADADAIITAALHPYSAGEA
jgi:glutamate-ammonia-ligase adenylyltransferase